MWPKQPPAESQQDNRDLSPTTARTRILPTAMRSWKTALSYRKECSPADALAAALGDPEQRTQEAVPRLLIHRNWGILHGCCVKLLNLWSFVRWEVTNTPLEGE